MKSFPELIWGSMNIRFLQIECINGYDNKIHHNFYSKNITIHIWKGCNVCRYRKISQEINTHAQEWTRH